VSGEESSNETLIVVQASSNRGVAADGQGKLGVFPFRRRSGRPLPGDRVILDAAGALDRILPRNNRFGRGDNRGRFKPIAANLDQVVIVIAAEPAPSRDLLHRYLAAAHIHRIHPLVVVNKADLELPQAPPFDELDGLRELGYDIIRTSCLDGSELNDLPARLANRVSLLAGQSGVGKSSLLNALIPDLDLQTGALSRVTGKGTHTTTTATLHQLPDGGWVVDTPGVWEFGLWQMSAEELQQGFPEFTRIPGNCRFRNCRHRDEPGCAIRAAVDNGELPAFRWQAWLRLLAEQDRLGGRQGSY
jgi:ribosome biogenesis GTPase / thiamine phosphate phosphatase